MTHTYKAHATTEIVGALATGIADKDTLKAFSADPHSVMASELNLDVSGVDIQVVENKGNDVNLILPYYEMLDSSEAQAVRDDAMAKISGGEIFISLGIIVGTLAGVAISTSTTVMIAGGIIGGAVGASVVATTVIGGIAGGTHEKRKAEGKK